MSVVRRVKEDIRVCGGIGNVVYIVVRGRHCSEPPPRVTLNPTPPVYLSPHNTTIKVSPHFTTFKDLPYKCSFLPTNKVKQTLLTTKNLQLWQQRMKMLM